MTTTNRTGTCAHCGRPVELEVPSWVGWALCTGWCAYCRQLVPAAWQAEYDGIPMIDPRPKGKGALRFVPDIGRA